MIFCNNQKCFSRPPKALKTCKLLHIVNYANNKTILSGKISETENVEAQTSVVIWMTFPSQSQSNENEAPFNLFSIHYLNCDSSITSSENYNYFNHLNIWTAFI